MKIIIVILLIGIIFGFITSYVRNVLKVTYYERLLRANKLAFSDMVFKDIEKVINDKWILIKHLLKSINPRD